MKQTKQKRKPASRTVSSSINQVQRPGPSVIQPKAVRGTAPATRQVPPPQVAPTQPVTQVSRTSLSTTPESSVSIMPANAALHTQPSTAEVVPVPPRPALPAEPVLPSDHQEPTVVVPEIPAQSSPEEKNEVSQTSAQPKEEAAWQQSEAQATYLDSETEHKPDRPVSHTPTPTSKAEVDLERSSM